MSVTLNQVLSAIKSQDGFLRKVDIDNLASLDRLRQVLVRCNIGRFQCAAQDVAHFIAIITNEGSDWVRDVSLPTTDPIWAEEAAPGQPVG